jgi:hypothetical protein
MNCVRFNADGAAVRADDQLSTAQQLLEAWRTFVIETQLKLRVAQIEMWCSRAVPWRGDRPGLFNYAVSVAEVRPAVMLNETGR